MLFRKKEEKPRICVGCGCLVVRWRAKKVIQDILNDANNPMVSYFEDLHPLFYCLRCAPPYDFVSYPTSGGASRYFSRIVSSYKEVDKEGKPLKKKK